MSGANTADGTASSAPIKNFTVKPARPGQAQYGCEHVQIMLTKDQATTNLFIHRYKSLLRCLFDRDPLVPQMARVGEAQKVLTSVTCNYLCLQCNAILIEEEILKHGNKKSHRFFIDSRNGTVYCQMCDDVVWDPSLEELRIRKLGTGTFSASRKRKHDEVDPVKDDPKYIAANTIVPSCKVNGLRGLYNAGATCYQNVVLQSFLHNPILRNFYLSDGHRCGAPYCLSCAMDDMFQEFYGQDNTNGYTAANVLSGFWISEKKAFENLVTTKEQDAHEFFQFLAEELHERNGDGKKPEIGSEHSCNCIMHRVYYGKLQTTTTCQHCHGVTNQVQSFLDLSLPLENLPKKGKKAAAAAAAANNGKAPTSVSLQECLDEEFVKSDKCEYRCNSCNSTQQARRQTSINRLPNVLSIQLKRFEFKTGGRNDKATKIDTQVHFPLQLNMLPYTARGRSPDAKNSPELVRSCMYDLFCVIQHVGDIDTGHYVCYCRVVDQWFAFNDHKVEVANISDVLGSKAYLLFYIIRYLS